MSPRQLPGVVREASYAEAALAFASLRGPLSDSVVIFILEDVAATSSLVCVHVCGLGSRSL